MRTGLAALLVALAVAAPDALGASTTAAPRPAPATAAFGRLLRGLYGPIHGYWTCFPPAIAGRVDCMAEFHAAGRWHEVSGSARWYHGVIAITIFSNGAAVTWVRRWSPYSRRYILRSDEPQVPGVVSVNGPAYDWGWLAQAAGEVKAGQTKRLSAYDGDANGIQRFEIFTCSRPGGLITCRNALGDAMRYRPHG